MKVHRQVTLLEAKARSPFAAKCSLPLNQDRKEDGVEWDLRGTEQRGSKKLIILRIPALYHTLSLPLGLSLPLSASSSHLLINASRIRLEDVTLQYRSTVL